LLEYRWPGNVAELETIAKRVAITNRERPGFHLDKMIADRLATPEPKPPRLAGTAGAAVAPEPGTDVLGAPAPLVSASARKDAASLEDADIARAMRDHGFKIKAVAEALGVSRSWLNTRLESCQGVRKAKELSREEILEAAHASAGALPRMAERLEVSEHGLKLRMKALELGER
jgi:two-component system nitrogen regulation response regulator GlnG